MICKRCGTVFCDDLADESSAPRLYCSKSCRKKAPPSRGRHQRRRRTRRHGDGSPASCPKPSKTRYTGPEAARRKAERAADRAGLVLRPYECRCGWWHLTSMPLAAQFVPLS